MKQKRRRFDMNFKLRARRCIAFGTERRLLPKARWSAALLLLLAVFAIYLASGHTYSHLDSGDTVPTRLIPFSLLRFGTVTMDPFRSAFAVSGGYRWYVQERHGHLVSYYPIGSVFVALPFYLPLFLWLLAVGRTSAMDLFAFAPLGEKIVAAAIAASTVAVVWWVLRRRLRPVVALMVSLVFAFCTLMWPIAGEQLWQHGPAALMIAVGYALLTAEPSARRTVGAGLAFGLLVAVRPQTIPFAVAGACAAWVVGEPDRRWRRLAQFSAGAMPLIAMFLAYNLATYGKPGGGYQVFAGGLFGLSYLAPGVAGLLFSPNRGALILMPVIGVGLAGGAMAVWRWRQDPTLALLVLASGGYFLLHSATMTWAGGWCFGPRYLTETLPVLAIASGAAVPALRSWTKALLVPLIAWSLLIQFAGANFYPYSNWHGRTDGNIEAAAWRWDHFMPWEDFEAWRVR